MYVNISTLQFSLSAGEVGNSSVNIYNTEIMELFVNDVLVIRTKELKF